MLRAHTPQPLEAETDEEGIEEHPAAHAIRWNIILV